MTLLAEQIEHYQPIFLAIASKLSSDPSLREDLVQSAFLELLRIDEKQIRSNPDAFIRMVAKFTMLSELRTHTRRAWGQRKGRFVDISTLLEKGLVQISEEGELLPGASSHEEAGYYVLPLREGGMSVLLDLHGSK